jgi:serine/threonine protein kinase
LQDSECLSWILHEKRPIETEEEEDMILCFTDLLEKMLEMNPEKRLSAKQGLCHPFVTGDEWIGRWTAPEDGRGPRVLRNAVLEEKRDEKVWNFDPIQESDVLALF